VGSGATPMPAASENASLPHAPAPNSPTTPPEDRSAAKSAQRQIGSGIYSSTRQSASKPVPPDSTEM